MAKLNNKIQVSVSDLEQFKTLASQVGSLKKLNEELTAENARLLTELETANDRVSHFKFWNDGYKAEILKLKNDLEMETHFKCNERQKVKSLETELKNEVQNWAKLMDEKTEFQIEITSIKSKWWYKLMTWGW